MASVGASVARLSDARLSMIRFTHSWDAPGNHSQVKTVALHCWTPQRVPREHSQGGHLQHHC